MTERIADLTLEHLGDMTTEADLSAFRAAARNYLEANGGTEEEAIDAIWDNDDYFSRIAEWVPEEFEAAEAAARA